MRGKALWGGLGALVMGGLATALWGAWGDTPHSPQTKSVPPVPVTTAVAVRQDLPHWLDGVGNVKPFNTVPVRPQVDGQLLRVAFSEGQTVKSGDLLAVIDPRPYQAALDQAIARRDQDAAQLDNARLDLGRQLPLAAKGYISAQQVDATQARVRQLEAAVKGDVAAIDAARLQLDHTTIRAPIDGRAGFRQVDPGVILHGGGFESGGSRGSAGMSGSSDTVVTLTQMQPISVVFTLSQDGLPLILGALARGRVAVAVLGRDKTRTLEEGELDSIDNQIDTASGTLRLKARFTNKSGQLWPGQYVSVRVAVATHADAVTVPAAALVKSPEGERVFVARPDDTVESRPVSTGIAEGERVEILGGLEGGETVVISGQQRLRPGARIAGRPQSADRKG